jgi:hypothetical protein
VTAPSRAGWALACACALASCAATWPDERGAPVPASLGDNARAAEAFRAALVAARAGTTLPEPTVTSNRQARVRQIADALQRGDISAGRARDAAQRWGETATRGAVDVWVLDCAAGARMRLPGGLTSPPVLALAFAASHFRPASLPTVQCAVIVVSARGGERVGQSPPGAP